MKQPYDELIDDAGIKTTLLLLIVARRRFRRDGDEENTKRLDRFFSEVPKPLMREINSAVIGRGDSLQPETLDTVKEFLDTWEKGQ